jgi:undecaprenyl-diphosphatase
MRVRTGRFLDPWVVTGIACAAGFLLLAVLVNGQRALGFDAAVKAAVTGLPIPTDAWLAITALGGVILIPVGVIFVLALLWRRRFRLALIVAVALIGAALGTELFKDVVSRPRPPGDAYAAAEGYSFPSGHTLNSTVTYGLIALVIWRSRLATWARRTSASVLVALPILVGLSRIALGVHYPSDVLAGWLAGVAVVAVVAVLTEPATADLPGGSPEPSLSRQAGPGTES